MANELGIPAFLYDEILAAVNADDAFRHAFHYMRGVLKVTPETPAYWADVMDSVTAVVHDRFYGE